MKRSKIIALIVVVAAVIGLFVIILFSSRPYIEVSKVTSNPSKYYDKSIQVIGVVADYSGGNFNLTEDAHAIRIDVSATDVPAGLVDGMQIVVTGVLNSSLILKATQIVTECS